MKYLDENGASRLLEKIKAYADRKVAEVDLRGGGTVEGELHLNSGLVVDWISDPTATWEINQDGCIRCVDLNASGGVAGSLGSFETLDADSVTALSGKFDKVEIGEITNPYVSPSILLKVGEGGIWSQGSIFSLTSVETVHVEADSAKFKQLDVAEQSILTGTTTIANATLIGSIGSGSNGNWSIDSDGTIFCEDISINNSFSNAGPSQFEAEADFNDIARFAEETYFYNNLLGYNNATLSWYIAKSGFAKFSKIINIPEFYQIPDDVLAKFDSADLLNALQSLITMEYGDLNLDPSSLQVTGYVVNTLAPNTAFVRISVGFQLALGENILFAPGADKATCAKLTADGETVLMIPLSTDCAGFFEYWFPVNKTNWSFISNAKYKLGVVYTDSMNSK